MTRTALSFGLRSRPAARRIAGTLLLGALALGTRDAWAQTTALVGARVIDGRGQAVANATIVVRDGKIIAMGPAASTTVPAGATRVELAGATVMPGLVNAHGHLTGADGMRNNPDGYTRAHLIKQLSTYAQYGVTTVFSLGDDQEAAFELRNEQGAGPLTRARLFVAGPVINGADAAAARAMTDRVAAMKPDLLKIRIDDNLGSSRKMPEDAWRATIARARELKLPVATHIFYLQDARAALMAGAGIVAHSVRDVPVDAELTRELKARDGCYIPTLMREVSTFVYGSTPPWAADPFFIKGAGAAITEELADPARHTQVQSTPGYKQGLRYKEGLEVAKRNLKTVSDTGARVAMGTDSGPAGRWQGFFEHLELEMMVESGMTPMQVIVSATGAAAACHGRSGQFGTIQPGASADFLVLAANPLDDIRNTRQIKAVWIAGRELR
jgi:imidazolonepropionase-like amidohydrolase